MKIAGLFLLGVLAVCAGAAPPPLCPPECVCSTTNEGLHKAACSSTLNLYKFSLRNKHNNVNIIDLSNSSIAKINGDLDKFTEVVSIDLSSNKIEQFEKLLKNSKKLVHLNLARNEMKSFSASSIPSSVSSLDLTSNLLTDVPLDLNFLTDLEHLELSGNPLSCSCENLKRLNGLRNRGIVMDRIICFRPSNKGVFWGEVDIFHVCSEKKSHQNGKIHNLMDDMMLGDQPDDVEMIGVETTHKKSMTMTALSDLDEGEVWEDDGMQNDDDAKEFIGVASENHLKVSSTPQPDIDLIDGSGDDSVTEIITSRQSGLSFAQLKIDDNLYENTTTDEPEGSGDFGSGMDSTTFDDAANATQSTTIDPNIDYYDGSGDDLENITTTTEPFITGVFNPFFYNGNFDDNTTTLEPFVIPDMPSVFQGKVDWDAPEETTTKAPEPVEEILTKVDIGQVESGLVEASDNEANNEELLESKEARSSLGTYVCIGILVVLLVGLIGVATIKSHMRKKRNQRLERQDKKDVEKAGREMVDMNKSLLGKPVIAPNSKKVNGSYELVPTHDTKKKNENGNIDNKKSVEENIPKVKVPEVSAAPNGNTNKPNPNVQVPHQGKYTPLEDPPLVGIMPPMSEPDGPMTNGNKHPEMNLLPPPHEAMPVYQPDSGRVRIKLTETPKPKTPVLVMRSRSDADGKIITTPSLDQSPKHKSDT